MTTSYVIIYGLLKNQKYTEKWPILKVLNVANLEIANSQMWPNHKCVYFTTGVIHKWPNNKWQKNSK